MILEIPMIPCGPNSSNGLFRMHWARRRNYFRLWAMQVDFAYRTKYGFAPRVAFEKSVVKIHQVRKRRLDSDNLWASVKPCLDAMVKAKIIADDDPGHIELTVTQETGRQTRTIISVEEWV